MNPREFGTETIKDLKGKDVLVLTKPMRAVSVNAGWKAEATLPAGTRIHGYHSIGDLENHMNIEGGVRFMTEQGFTTTTIDTGEPYVGQELSYMWEVIPKDFMESTAVLAKQYKAVEDIPTRNQDKILDEYSQGIIGEEQRDKDMDRLERTKESKIYSMWMSRRADSALTKLKEKGVVRVISKPLQAWPGDVPRGMTDEMLDVLSVGIFLPTGIKVLFSFEFDDATTGEHAVEFHTTAPFEVMFGDKSSYSTNRWRSHFKDFFDNTGVLSKHYEAVEDVPAMKNKDQILDEYSEGLIGEEQRDKELDRLVRTKESKIYSMWMGRRVETDELMKQLYRTQSLAPKKSSLEVDKRIKDLQQEQMIILRSPTSSDPKSMERSHAIMVEIDDLLEKEYGITLDTILGPIEQMEENEEFNIYSMWMGRRAMGDVVITHQGKPIKRFMDEDGALAWLKQYLGEAWRVAMNSGEWKIKNESKVVANLYPRWMARRAEHMSLENVRIEIAQHFMVDIDDVEMVSEGFFEVGQFEIDRTRYNWIVDEDEAETIAISQVEDQFTSDPEIWMTHLQGYIDEERLGKDLASDERDSYQEVVDEMDGDAFGLDADENGDFNEAELEAAREKKLDEHVEDIEDNPIAHLEGLYGRNWQREYDVSKYLNENQAAKDLVDNDGWINSLNSHDSEYEITRGGVVVFADDDALPDSMDNVREEAVIMEGEEPPVEKSPPAQAPTVEKSPPAQAPI